LLADNLHIVQLMMPSKHKAPNRVPAIVLAF